MNRSMINASVSMGQLQRKIDTIGHNLANSNTNGYKRRETNFQDLLVQQFDNQRREAEETGRRTPNGIRTGVGARLSETELVLEQGGIKTTDRDLDLALAKENHFFEISSVDNNGQVTTRYTRDGAFYVSPSAGNPNVLDLVTANGDRVLGTNGPIQIPAGFEKINIDESGQIMIDMPTGPQQNAGQIAVSEVIRPQLLVSAGDNQFALPNLQELGIAEQDVVAPADPQQVGVKQRALEMSNVDMGQEMTELMTSQRQYQFNAKSISISDQMMQLVNGLRT
ncbi:flagellar hook-basal body protein [Bacillus tianshenii]|nr:flagellar hook-basal body protein [Bacillus tianshenii]